MEIKRINHSDFINSLLFNEYKNRIVFKKFSESLVNNLSQDCEDQTFNIIDFANIDNAEGNQLEINGDLIGLPRMSVKIGDLSIWELDETSFTNHKFGDKNYLLYQLAPDDIYRSAIKSFSIQQTSNGNLFDLLSSLVELLAIEESDISINITSSLTVSIIITATNIDERRKFLVDEYKTPNDSFLWPRCMGVTYTFTYSS